MANTDKLPSSFDSIIDELITKQNLSKEKVSRKEYEAFCQEYIFDVLKNNMPFGLAFCKRFEIEDFLVQYVFDDDIPKCKELIEEAGYIKEA